MNIHLSDEDIADCEEVGQERNRIQIAAGVRDLRVGGSSGEAINIQGAKGELAFCLAMNVPKAVWKQGAVKAAGEKKAFDMSYNQWKVEVKSTPHPARNLLVPARQGRRADFIALFFLTEPADLDFIGWIEESRWEQVRVIRQLHTITWFTSRYALGQRFSDLVWLLSLPKGEI